MSVRWQYPHVACLRQTSLTCLADEFYRLLRTGESNKSFDFSASFEAFDALFHLVIVCKYVYQFYVHQATGRFVQMVTECRHKKLQYLRTKQVTHQWATHHIKSYILATYRANNQLHLCIMDMLGPGQSPASNNSSKRESL